jgi:hypothetical protein
MTTCRAASLEMSTVGMEMLRKVPDVGPAKVGRSAAWRIVLHEIASRHGRDRRDMIQENGGGEGISRLECRQGVLC